MLLSIATTYEPATDLGYLLHKHPDRVHTSDLSFGRAHVFFPEATSVRCTAAMVVEVDPIGIVRNRLRHSGEDSWLAQYVNDRPYVASSFLSVALGHVFSTAMGGRCKDRPELIAEKIPLEATLPLVYCRGGAAVARRIFEPLGYRVEVWPLIPAEGPPEPSTGGGYVGLRIFARMTIAELLNHLYLLLPVLDDFKHYWVGSDEVEKLQRRGSGWLEQHPDRDLIVARYLGHRRSLTRDVLSRFAVEEGQEEPQVLDEKQAQVEETLEHRISLQERRLEHTVRELESRGVRRVIDLGCGEGQLVLALARSGRFDRICGVDISLRELARAKSKVERLAEKSQERITFLHASILYRDRLFDGYEAAILLEVIEHLEPDRLLFFEQSVFGSSHPGLVLVSTPNREYNVNFPGIRPSAFRHGDHRFEWTRREFATWAERVGSQFGYGVQFLGIGPEDAAVGCPCQMAVFERRRAA